MTTINTTELFDRTDRAFYSLRELAAKNTPNEQTGVTLEWARLHAKGDAVANANTIFRTQFADLATEDLETAVTAIQELFAQLIDNAENELVEVDNGFALTKENYRNAIALGHVEGYKVAADYLRQEIPYFTR